jgi:hypothetical protein
MKIYIHQGPGHYIGSAVVVVAESNEMAERLVRISLDTMGLLNEEILLTEFEIKPNTIIYTQSGDY